jgi:hypothetical protein
MRDIVAAAHDTQLIWAVLPCVRYMLVGLVRAPAALRLNYYLPAILPSLFGEALADALVPLDWP